MNEFKTRSSPVSALALDLCSFFNSSPSLKATTIYISKNYRPGGVAWARLKNFFLLHTLLPLILLFHRVLGVFRSQKLVVVSTTNPPFMHWSALFWAKLFLIPSVLWYEDAHPGLENYFLQRMKIFFLPPLLNVLDKIFINWAKTIVVLDKAMAQHVSNITDRNNNVHVIPPWATYLEPAKTMRVPKFSEEKISLLYAGNYGFAHSLVPLKECLAKVDPLKRSKVHMCFVGMNEQAQQKIRELFANLNLQLTFAPRFANLVDLCSFMENFDLGIVSLRMDYAGFACPSKALTYLSQGLPVFYVGPKYTLSYELVEEGYGLPLSKEFFEAPLEFVRRSKLQSMLGKVFPNPAEQAKKDFLKLVEKYV